MLSEFEADTAEYILVKFAMIHIYIKEREYGYSVRGELKGQDHRLLWIRYYHIVNEARIRLPGSFIAGEIKDGALIVEIY